ncbi:MAG: hypothetical protein PUD59_00635 [bacterium]|nr:hypothetical protein [bacterium]
MNFKELECPNCGAELEVPENSRKIKCEYCRKVFEVESTYNKAYDTAKGVIDAQIDASERMYDQFENTPANKFFRIFFFIMFLIVIVIVCSIIIFNFKDIVNQKRMNLISFLSLILVLIVPFLLKHM